MYKLVAIALVAASIMAQAATTTANTVAYPADPYCRGGATNTCASCGGSYAGANGICQRYTAEIVHCERYATATTCAECEHGFYLNNNACTAIGVTDCAVVTPTAPTICTGCENSKIATATGSCTDGANCTLANCDICASNTRCLRCSARYSLTAANTCVSQPHANCLAVTTSTGATPVTTCSLCEFGYYSTGTSCVATDVQDNASIFSALVALFAFVKLMA